MRVHRRKHCKTVDNQTPIPSYTVILFGQKSETYLFLWSTPMGMRARGALPITRLNYVTPYAAANGSSPLLFRAAPTLQGALLIPPSPPFDRPTTCERNLIGGGCRSLPSDSDDDDIDPEVLLGDARETGESTMDVED